MSAGVTIWRCVNCHAALFPEPLLCPHCHGAAFEIDRVREAVIEEVSVIRHMIGQENWQPHRIANVRTVNGPLMTVGLRDESGAGATIELFEAGTAPFGRAKA
jgi:ABC-type ATPase with predicted acetyltransferase domain